MSIDKDCLYYLVNYECLIEDLTKYNDRIIKKYRSENIDNELFYISCNLLSILLLKEIMCGNNKKYYVVPVEKSIFLNLDYVSRMNDIFVNNKRKSFLVLLISGRNYINYKKEIIDLKHNGYKIIINCDDENILGKVVQVMDVRDILLIDKKVEDSSEEYLKYVKTRNIEYILQDAQKKILKNHF